jgi:hypothetical protein
MRIMIRLVGLMAAALFTGAVVAVPASGATTSTNLYTPLYGSTAYPTAAGYSYYSGMGMMGGRDVKVTVNHITRLAGQRVTVFLNGTRVGTMLVSSTGSAYHDWTGSSAPSCMSGSRVAVRTSSGTTIDTGTYRYR